jgi:hypothetical protein
MRLPFRYAGWMSWDLVRGPGIVMLIVGVLAAVLINSLTVVTSSGAGETAVFLAILDFAVTIFALLATGGMVSTDFAMGYYRPLFARPVSPPLYYLLRWLLGGVLALTVTAVVALAAALRMGADLPLGRALLQAALSYLLIGGLVFVLSTFTRRDWLIAILIIAAYTSLGFARALGVAGSGAAAVLYDILPPLDLVDMADPLPSGRSLVYVLLYGIGLVGAALLVLRFRPLARGARE